MYIVPSASGLCLYSVQDYFGASSQAGASVTSGGAAGGCSSDIAEALADGIGGATGERHRQINFGIFPDAHPAQRVTLRGGHTRVVRPAEGFFIIIS